jgi:hypothetical protein
MFKTNQICVFAHIAWVSLQWNYVCKQATHGEAIISKISEAN